MTAGDENNETEAVQYCQYRILSDVRMTDQMNVSSENNGGKNGSVRSEVHD